MTEPHLATQPIGLIVSDDRKLSRLTVFFRYWLALPQAIWILIWGIAAAFAQLAAWLIAIFTGRVPDGLHTFLARYLRANVNLQSYLFLLANPWPPFDGEPGYPVDVRIDPPVKQNRWTVVFRGFLAIPAMLISYVFRIVNSVVAFLGWFYALVMGEMPAGMRNASAWMLGYETQTYGYLMFLTDRYPSFAGGPTA